MSTTIKFGSKFDASWIVVDGNPTEMRDQLILAFGLDGADDKTLAEVTIEASQIAQAMWNAADGLNATVDNKWPSSNDRGARPKKSEQPKTQDPKQETLDAISGASDKAGLIRVWLTVPAEYKKDEVILEAFKSKGAEFK